MTPADERRIAEAATKRPWWTNRDIRPPLVFAGDGSASDKTVAEMFEQADADFAATFNPQRVLELLDTLDVMEERHSLERLQIERLEARLAAVEKLHTPSPHHCTTAENCVQSGNGYISSGDKCFACSDGVQHCDRCIEPWPCDDIKAVRGE